MTNCIFHFCFEKRLSFIFTSAGQVMITNLRRHPLKPYTRVALSWFGKICGFFCCFGVYLSFFWNRNIQFCLLADRERPAHRTERFKPQSMVRKDHLQILFLFDEKRIFGEQHIGAVFTFLKGCKCRIKRVRHDGKRVRIRCLLEFQQNQRQGVSCHCLIYLQRM